MKSFRRYVEVSDNQLDKLKKTIKQANKGKLGRFDDIFGNKLRIVIPLNDTPLGRLGYKVDLEKGTASYAVDTFKCKKCGRQIQTSKKPQSCPSCQGEIEKVPGSKKERTERIGTILSKLIKSQPGQDWEQVLHWWERNKERKKDKESGISIIISRSPIDVVRMSDHREFNSCHSPPNSTNTTGWKQGSYFRCAVQEARSGGAVAYVVRTSDLRDVNLQAPEIFQDRDRKIKGIEPLERLRLRRFSDGKTDILIPEVKTYGIKHVNFAETVIAWAKNAQREIVNNPPDFKNFNLHGGSYQDNNASTLWNDFFGTRVYGSKKSVDQKKENEGQKWTVERLQTAAEETLEAHQSNWKYCGAYVEAEETDGQPYLHFNGSVVFEFDEKLFEKIPDDKDLQNTWRNEGPKTLGRQIRDALDFGVIEEITIDDRINEKVRFFLDIRHEDDGYGQGDRPRDLIEFEGLLDELDEIEGDYNLHYSTLMHILIETGFMRDWRANLKFKHFQIGGANIIGLSGVTSTKWSISQQSSAVSEEMWIGEIKEKEVGSSYKHAWTSWSGRQIQFRDEHVTENAAKVIFPFKQMSPQFLMFNQEGDKFTLQLQIPINDKSILKIVQIIDSRFDYFQQRAVQWWNKMKPVLMGQGTDYPAKMPVKRPPKSPQRLLPGFREWIIIEEIGETICLD